MTSSVFVKTKKARGFSLIELLTVIVIASILLMIGVPSYKSMIASNNAYTENNNLFSDLQMARSEAIKQGLPITVCSADTSGNAPYICSDSSDWTGGWIICSVCVAVGNSVIKVQQPINSGSSIASSSDTVLTRVVYNAFGFTTVKGSVSTTPSGEASPSKTICISAVGNLQTVSGDDGLCP